MPAEGTPLNPEMGIPQSALPASLVTQATVAGMVSMSPPQASLAQARGSDHLDLASSVHDTPPPLSTELGVLPTGPAAAPGTSALATTSSPFPSGEADLLRGPRSPSGQSLAPTPAGGDAPGVLEIRRLGRITKCVTSPLFGPLIATFAGLTSFHPSSGGWGRPFFRSGAFEEASYQHHPPCRSGHIVLRL